ncbi:MAG: hypothetical protein HOV81_41675 [Kofleriaceae bacterium]|nr:hypothetical protein [Kofleriaceae bacterium]
MRRWLGVVVVSACSSPSPKAPQDEHAVPICSGQRADSQATETTPRTGPMETQLSPGFLDRMAPCSRDDARPSAKLAVANRGTVNARGDCEWPNGVTCHFHRGAEFVESGQGRPVVGELHCLFPTSLPKNPIAYGTHFTCKAGTSISQGPADNTCGASLLSTLSQVMSRCEARCCDDGTLTEPAEARQKSGELDVRPDFRICTTTEFLDCSLLAGMRGREANAPVFGPPIDHGM